MIVVANKMAERGYDVDMVLAKKTGPFLEEIAPEVNLVDLGVDRIFKSFMPFSRYIKRVKPAVVISPLVGTDVIALASKIAFRWKSRLYISVQNAPVSGATGAALERNWPRIIKAMYRFADKITAISAGVGHEVEALMGLKPRAVEIINNPVAVDQVAKRMVEAPAHPWLADKSEPVVIAVGRLTEQKDFPCLLQAFAKLRAQRAVRLVILGEGPDRAKLEALAADLGVQDSVSMPGFDRNPFAAMHAADVFILSSRWEGFANVVAEALACGTKVVSTDCPSGPAEILDNGAFGTLVPVGDADAMAVALADALDAPIERERLIERSRQFSADIICDRYLDAFGARKAN